ncbi:condensation domain-containing protein, partial [Xanthomonas arboricola]|uniref:condensation domain-containing protein n=1 Tax=Xanthomonas arboricola TaxID=56448 RepID=UPI001E3C98A1
MKDIYPLSPMQRGMLFHALYAPGEGSYVEQVSYRLEGELDQAAFVEAWKVVLSHHDVLRTAFLWEGLDAPVQVVRTTAAPSYVFQDWQGETEDRLQRHLADFLSHDRRRSFDLACAPLTRFMLARTGPRTHYLVWTFHHLVLDGWSIPLVLRDLFTAYSALCTGAAPVLPRARPFSDYIAWLQEQPEHEAMAFWAENFNGYAATATTVPMPGTPAPAADGEEYAETSFRIPAAATSQLETFARQQQLTLNTLLLGAWSLLLGRYTDSEDVVVGSTVSGRSPNLQGGGAMVGMFVNTLPVRSRMDANRPVADWLRQLQKQLLDAREYEHCPLVQIQAWGGVPRGAALFDSIIAFQNQPISEVLGHLESAVRVLPLVDRHTRTAYPLTLMIEPGESMSVTVVYDTRRFGKDDLTRISGHLQTMLSSIASDPQRPLGELQMITAAEREAQLRSRAGPALAVPAIAGLMHQLFEAQAAARPQAVVLVEGTQVLRYGELNAQANRLAHYLIGQG